MKKVREGYKTTEIGEIPSEWDIKKIGDMTEIKTGGTPSTKCLEYWENGTIPWMVSGDVNRRIINYIDGRITECGMKNSAAKMLPKDTVMIALNGQGKTKGTVAYLNTEVTCNQSLAGFLPQREQFNSKYLFYNLQSRYSEIRGLAGDGTRNGLNLGLLRDIYIPLPTIKEQEKIASVLSTVDEHIDNVDALIEKSKELKKGLMQQLLTKGIGHTKFKKTEIGEIPETWKIKKLGEIFRLSSGNFLSQKNIVEGSYPVYGGNGITGYHNEFLFNDSKLVIGRVGAKCGCVCISEPNAWITDNALYISEIIEKFDKNYMYYLLDNINLNSYANQNAQPVISGQKIYSIFIGFPNIKEQVKISSILVRVDKKIEDYENKKQKLEELKNGLMQQLLTGKIRVGINY